jgi:hypothetical protein
VAGAVLVLQRLYALIIAHQNSLVKTFFNNFYFFFEGLYFISLCGIILVGGA